MRLPELTQDERNAFLGGTWVAKLATQGADGAVRMTPLGFAVEDETLLFSTWEDGTATRNLRRDARASVLIDDPNPPYKGVHYVGTAEVWANDRSPEQLAAVFGHYSRSREEAAEFYDFIRTLGARVLVRFTPERAISWDLSKV